MTEGDLPDLARMMLALAFVLGLMGSLTYLLKKLGVSANLVAPRNSKDRRLRIIESLPLDARRRLVILQCDEIQYLVILNANGETVLKNDITNVGYESVDSSDNKCS